MAKLRFLLSVLLFLTVSTAGAQYRVYYELADDMKPEAEDLLKKEFPARIDAAAYLAQLPFLIQAKGFITASIDSIQMDSAAARVSIFLGKKYRWKQLHPPHSTLFPPHLGPQMAGLRGNLEFNKLNQIQQEVLDHLEENGYPFGKVFLDSISIEQDAVSAVLAVEPGPLYKIDSIRIYGEAKVDHDFLQRYLDIPNGSIYNRKKLSQISRKLSSLQYLEEERPSDLTLLGTGSVLNLYLRPRRSSQVNALVGLLPNSSQLSGNRKLLLTVDANVLLRNAFGSGETLGLVWQQLQPQSPRLNLLYEKPYVFRTSMGLNFSLDMYKRDSSFLNLNMNLGALYRLDENRSGSVYIQRRQSIVSAFNEAAIISSRTLPQDVDVHSVNLGVTYQVITTDYRFNPRKGFDITLNTSAGTRSIRRNQQILELKDPTNPSFDFSRLYDSVKMKTYQLRLTAAAARFFPLGKASAVKTSLSGGYFQSPSIFRNEMFQIGGFKLLRGFDEESEFVSAYAVGTLEYRYLVDRNSNFFVFVDGGYGRHQLSLRNPDHFYISTGAGFSFETKAGILNLAWAVGKRDDLEFNLRQSKVHIGFASYF